MRNGDGSDSDFVEGMVVTRLPITFDPKTGAHMAGVAFSVAFSSPEVAREWQNSLSRMVSGAWRGAKKRLAGQISAPNDWKLGDDDGGEGPKAA